MNVTTCLCPSASMRMGDDIAFSRSEPVQTVAPSLWRSAIIPWPFPPTGRIRRSRNGSGLLE